ncbi:ribonuclease HII [Candidatus Nanohalobium constans]|uniref:Ribonuclease HII n=1 Tax=Candidatus Nanohalobium constans TaxID=2565781 RepID=A0A5Q0UEW2_9ARCH|nr:ribonuclease HII [Candidatus Nanohalobium constans]QGA80088.1 ribonuclease HII [Candidatus Nanohalobium constans]
MTEKKVVGIDEAGRGPVIGSMFIGGFMVEESRLDEVEGLGVKDSKKLSDKKREDLAEKLREVGKPFLKEITASEIDDLREVMSLNEIEIQGFTDVIERSDADKIIVDLPEPDGDRFINKMKRELPASFSDREFIAEHEADDNFPIVSAASIIAKSARENHVDELKEKYGYDFKSGYPHDKPTINFLEDYLEEKGELPPETRLSWSTAERIVKENSQKSFDEF